MSKDYWKEAKSAEKKETFPKKEIEASAFSLSVCANPHHIIVGH